METQRTEGEGEEPEHTHPAVVHTHDHYHVVHWHRGSPVGDFTHRTFWHTHAHNHGELTHSHDYSREDETAYHAKEGHVHDHAVPTESPA